MEYSQDYAKSARRHLVAAQKLDATVEPGARPGCRAVAGYVYGLSGELAVKFMMRASGMKPLPSTQRRDDPFYSHFPFLKARLLELAQGRRAGDLRAVALDPRLFHDWSTDMRYAPTVEIDGKWVDDWKASAEDLIGKMDL